MVDSPPPYFSAPPDLWISIPNTTHRLPLTWQHTKAIQRLGRFFARLYLRVQQSEDQTGLEKYKSWMTTLFQMTASIHEGMKFCETKLTAELVGRNDADEICKYMTFDETTEDSLVALEEANTLITPLMDYIRECKGISAVHDGHSERSQRASPPE